MGTLANSDSPDEIQHNAAFHQSLHCLLRLNNIHWQKHIDDIQIFGMNMPFISSSEAKNAYFMSVNIPFNSWSEGENAYFISGFGLCHS